MWRNHQHEDGDGAPANPPLAPPAQGNAVHFMRQQHSNNNNHNNNNNNNGHQQQGGPVIGFPTSTGQQRLATSSNRGNSRPNRGRSSGQSRGRQRNQRHRGSLERGGRSHHMNGFPPALPQPFVNVNANVNEHNLAGYSTNNTGAFDELRPQAPLTPNHIATAGFVHLQQQQPQQQQPQQQQPQQQQPYHGHVAFDSRSNAAGSRNRSYQLPQLEMGPMFVSAPPRPVQHPHPNQQMMNPPGPSLQHGMMRPALRPHMPEPVGHPAGLPPSPHPSKRAKQHLQPSEPQDYRQCSSGNRRLALSPSKDRSSLPHTHIRQSQPQNFSRKSPLPDNRHKSTTTAPAVTLQTTAPVAPTLHMPTTQTPAQVPSTSRGKKKKKSWHYDDEEIKAWRAARRKNYPTDANIAKKAEVSHQQQEHGIHPQLTFSYSQGQVKGTSVSGQDVRNSNQPQQQKLQESRDEELRESKAGLETGDVGGAQNQNIELGQDAQPEEVRQAAARSKVLKVETKMASDAATNAEIHEAAKEADAQKRERKRAKREDKRQRKQQNQQAQHNFRIPRHVLAAKTASPLMQVMQGRVQSTFARRQHAKTTVNKPSLLYMLLEKERRNEAVFLLQCVRHVINKRFYLKQSQRKDPPPTDCGEG